MTLVSLPSDRHYLTRSRSCLIGAARSGALTQYSAVSTVPPPVRGDWVLFHPVYTPDELKAVEVSITHVNQSSR